ncbi:MAG: TonB-dependent receptor, partial [Bacteroidales bacterium]|nr:TonB-dependent receptor [Bacteroidales bacterium]
MSRLLFLLLFILSSSLAFSQSDTINLPDVEIIEHREMLETGTSVVKLDKIILKVKELSSLSEVLSENTSVFVKTYGRGSLSTASFRGTTASHTKVSWNNVSLSSPMLGMVDMS